MKKGATYLRSSKDRSDVSIDVQRSELAKLAAERQIRLVEEYSDVVESGKDTDRPGFRALYRDLGAGKFDTVLLLDTSRLSRRRQISVLFEHDAAKCGIEVIYKSLPDSDPITNMLLKSLMQAIDEWHSLTSKQKGLMGMEENIKKGFRAGGRAPRGYRLKHIHTGAIRDGEPVTKSKLEPSEEAPMMRRYLRARAQGRSRTQLAKELGLTISQTTLIGIEWNALTYAGHTVWNVRQEFSRGEGYKGGQKRRPREEWRIQRDTHKALITDEEAETILAQLQNNNHTKGRRESYDYLLTGILYSDDGRKYEAAGAGRYRVPKKGDLAGKSLVADTLEKAMLDRVVEDLKSDEFVDELHQQFVRLQSDGTPDAAREARETVANIDRQIAKMMDFAGQMSEPGPALRRVEELEAQRKAAVKELEIAAQEEQQAAALLRVTPGQIRRFLDEAASELLRQNKAVAKDMLTQLIDKIELNPNTLDCKVTYSLAAKSGTRMASPRVVELCPTSKSVTYVSRGTLRLVA